jgi:anti-sigma28 factor (negative regulator of flagellin synthesis)
MKIDNPLLSQVSANALQQSSGISQTSGGDGSHRSRADGHSDRVQLSNLSAALRDLNAEDPNRAQSVRAIEKTVADGAYKIDAGAMSRKIIREMTTA